MLRIRLRRVGKKGKPSYRIVVADSRAPRDGAYVEWIGQYDPMKDPPAVTLKEERAIAWLAQGAQPSDAVKRIFEWNGIIERTHTAAPVAEPVAEPAPEPTAEAVAEATDEPTAEAVAEATNEPVAEAPDEPAVEAVTEATDEPAAEAVAEATDEPAAEVVAEATAEATDEPAAG